MAYTKRGYDTGGLFSGFGGLVDPLAGLKEGVNKAGDIYESYIKDEKDKSLLDIKKAEEARSAKKFADEQAAKEFLKGYTPNIGIGGKGYETEGLRTFADKTGGQIQAVQDKYGLGQNRTLEDLMAKGTGAGSEFAQYQKDILDASKKATSGYGSGNLLATRESVSKAIQNDLLTKLGDPVLAKDIAKGFADDYLSRADILKAEEKRAAGEESRRKELANQAKWAIDQRNKNSKSILNKSGVTTGFLDQEGAREQIDKLNLGVFDDDTALEYWTNAVKAGADPKVAMSAIRNSLQRGWLTDDKVKSENAYLREVSNLQKKAAKAGATGVTDAEKALIFSEPVQARSLTDLITTGGKRAYEAGFGNAPVTTTTSRSNSLSNPNSPPSIRETRQSRTENRLNEQAPSYDSLLQDFNTSEPDVMPNNLLEKPVRNMTQKEVDIANSVIQKDMEDGSISAENLKKAQELRSDRIAELYNADAQATRKAIMDTSRGILKANKDVLPRLQRWLNTLEFETPSLYKRDFFTPEQLEQMKNK